MQPPSSYQEHRQLQIERAARREWCPDQVRYDRGKCGWPGCGCPDDVTDRNVTGELRAWMMTYWQMPVSSHDADNMISFLLMIGWRAPS